MVPEPLDAVKSARNSDAIAKHEAERVARREARRVERPSFTLSAHSWDEFPEEAMAEINLASRALDFSRRIAGGSLAALNEAKEGGDEQQIAEAEKLWAHDKELWLTSEDVLQEALIKHGAMPPGSFIAPTLGYFAPGEAERQARVTEK